MGGEGERERERHQFVVPPIHAFIGWLFFKILFVFREGKRGRETSMFERYINCGCLSHTPSWGPGPQPRHVP